RLGRDPRFGRGGTPHGAARPCDRRREPAPRLARLSRRRLSPRRRGPGCAWTAAPPPPTRPTPLLGTPGHRRGAPVRPTLAPPHELGTDYPGGRPRGRDGLVAGRGVSWLGDLGQRGPRDPS